MSSKTKGSVEVQATTTPAKKKKGCTVSSRAHFRDNAKPQMVQIGQIPMLAGVKEFDSGSLGWYLNGKTVIDVGGEPTEVQIGLNLTIVHSKELPQS